MFLVVLVVVSIVAGISTYLINTTEYTIFGIEINDPETLGMAILVTDIVFGIGYCLWTFLSWAVS